MLGQVEEETNQAKWHRGSGSDLNSNQSFRETVCWYTVLQLHAGRLAGCVRAFVYAQEILFAGGSKCL